MRSVRILAFGLMGFVSGCSGGGSAPAPDDGRAVTVTRLTTRWFEDGSTQVSALDEVASVDVSAPNGAGGLTSFPLAPTAPGTWSSVVPVDAGFWVVVGWRSGTRSYVWTTSRTVDLGVDLAGRGAAADVLSSTLSFMLSGLQPWSAANDVVQTFSFDGPGWAELDPGFSDGQTSGPVTIDFTQQWLPPLLASDRLWIAQGTSAPTPGSPADRAVTYHGITQISGVAMQPGSVTTATAAPVTQATTSGSIDLVWATTRFEAGLPPLDTSINPPEHFAQVVASPVPLAAPSPGEGWSLRLMRLGFVAPHADTNFGTLSWGEIAPSFHPALAVHYFGFVPRSAPGRMSRLLRCSIWVADELASAPAIAAPRVTMIRNPAVNGVLVATAPVTGVGVTPTLSWDPPAVGMPTSYRVELAELAASGPGTARRVVADAVVYAPSFAVPAGLLQAGKAYVARIEARVTPTDVSTARPWRYGLPAAAANVFTERFEP